MRRYHAEEPLGLVDRAWTFAEAAHAMQTRKSGEPYFVHPRTVATILADLMLDPTTIAAGLLHDCVEDVEGITVETIKKEFGQEVAQLVDGVTKLTRLDFTSREEQQAETLRKMILAMSKDIRVVLIKLADRLHNMKTLRYQPSVRQAAIAQETLDIYAPLAHRLGVFAIKQELEDLALLYIDPDGYHDLTRRIGMKRDEREAFIKSVIDQLRHALDEADIPCDITGRPKHFYSIYKKMVIQGRPFEQIFDLTAVRILVQTVSECYAALGQVHTLWRQIPNRFKDYISNPKPNLYQSLHTTVVGSNGMPFEVQIRTYEMHRIAEYGIAAHWRYKEGRQVGNDLDKKLYWLRNILDWQDVTKDSKEFVDSLKVDLFSDEVFVFTPKGAIIDLPRGATSLDFAYRIHTEIGNRCTGAKVNGRIVPLSKELETGDFVEILTSSASRGPSHDWLKIVKTSQAKAKIRQYFKKQFKDENIDLGRTMLEHEAQRRAADISALMKNDLVDIVLRKYSFQSVDDLYVAVGCGMVSAMHIIARLMEDLKRREKPAPKPVAPVDAEELAARNAQRQQLASSHGVFVEGDSGMLVRFAHCCNPIPGDEIVGYITRGRGVTVHKSDCVNALNSEHERMMGVSWDAQTDTSYLANVQIVATDHENLLGDIISHLNLMKIPTMSLNAKVHENGTSKIMLTLKIVSKVQLDKLIYGLQRRSDIIEVCRVGR
ncbi:MAG: bifunctional (p)ppGpp synthetase/guanosine-3',5'-bis(diphosphate) 3'-pyrophosphohydrolase [Oscillospiraceae bacterium]|nr:bifunctional (p)ppGpp synthetase/guanosine-3',5'-bis(diphosphate) 3'-pyrophosphohydrolase [Oscillospiraceae bacterium]